MAHSKGTPCPNCGARGAEVLYSVDDIPVNSCLLFSSREEACAFPRGQLRLAVCEGCGFLFNAAYDRELQEYSARYEETQGFSPTFNAFAGRLARRLIEDYDLRDRDILEIGCGKGEFLVLLCELGPNRGVGIDPSYRPERTKSPAAERIRFFRELYGPKHHHLKADMICCRHTLEHIGPTARFLSEVREAIGDRTGTLVFFEVPDVLRVLEEGAFWDIYYEHCSYFTTGSIARLYRASGLDVLDLWLDYDDQYVMITGRPANGGPSPALPLEDDLDRVLAATARFPEVVAGVQKRWRDELNEAFAAGRKVVLWGSGSKGVSFLTTLGLAAPAQSGEGGIEYVVDINPHRQGRFMPGTGQKIVSPEEVARYGPDLVIVQNPVYLDEIAEDLRSGGVACKLVAV